MDKRDRLSKEERETRKRERVRPVPGLKWVFVSWKGTL